MFLVLHLDISNSFGTFKSLGLKMHMSHKVCDKLELFCSYTCCFINCLLPILWQGWRNLMLHGVHSTNGTIPLTHSGALIVEIRSTGCRVLCFNLKPDKLALITDNQLLVRPYYIPSLLPILLDIKQSPAHTLNITLSNYMLTEIIKR